MTVPATNSYAVPYTLKSDMVLDVSQADGTLGQVFNDPVSGYNTIYQFAVATLIWTALSPPPPITCLFGQQLPDLLGATATSNLPIGAPVTGTGIPTGTTLSSINSSTQVTLSNAVTTSGAITMTFTPTSGAAISGVQGLATATSPVVKNLVSPYALMNAMGLYQAIKAGEVHLVAHGYAKADSGTTDNAPYINLIGSLVEARGGGMIIFDRPDTLGGWYGIKSPILLRNNVTFEGVDSSVLIRNTAINPPALSNTEACFHGNGIAQSNYPYYYAKTGTTCFALNDIVADSHSVTCLATFPFLVGQVVLIFSSGGESPIGTVTTINLVTPGPGVNFLPFFSRQYRITKITGSTIWLDYPIPIAVASPNICDGTGGLFGNIPTKLVDRPVIRNLRVSADDPNFGSSLIDSGMYEGLIENVGVDNGTHLLGANGLARTEVNGLRGFFSLKALELATGSHDCHIRHVRGAWNPNNSGILASLLSVGEYTANIEISDFNLFAPDAAPTNAAFDIGQTTGLRVSDGYVRYSGKGVNLQDKLAVATSDIEIRNVVLNLTSQSVNFDVTASASPGPYTFYPTDIRLRNVKFIGDAPTAAGIRFIQHCGIDFDNVDTGAAMIQVGAGCAPTGRMSRVKCTGWSGSFTDINQIDIKDMIRANGQGYYSAKRVLNNVSVTTTTATTTGVAGAVTAGTNFITAVSNTTGLLVTDGVSGSTAIPAGTWITSIVPLASGITGVTTTGSPYITDLSTISGIAVNQTISGAAGIPAGALVYPTVVAPVTGVTGTATNLSYTFTALSSTTGLAINQIVTISGGPALPTGTVVTAIGPGASVTVSNQATGAGVVTMSFSGVTPIAAPVTGVTGTANGTTFFTVSSIIGLAVNQTVRITVGPTVPGGTVVIAIGPGNSVTLSNAASGSGSVTMNFSAAVVLTKLVTAGASVTVNFSPVVYLSALATLTASPSSLTFTHYAAIFNLIAGQNAVQNDMIVLDAIGNINSTSPNNTITVRDDTGVLLSATIPVSVTRAFSLSAKTVIETTSPHTLGTTVCLSYNNPLSVITGITGTATVGGAAITAMSSTAGLVVGSLVVFTAGPATIPAITTIVSVDSSSQITLSANVGGTTGTATISFFAVDSSTVISTNTSRTGYNLANTPYNLYLQGAVGVVAGGNAVTFDRIDWRAQLYGEQ